MRKVLFATAALLFAIPAFAGNPGLSVSGTVTSGHTATFLNPFTLQDSGETAGMTSLTGDVTATGPGASAATVLRVHGVTFPATPTTNTVPVVTGTNTITYEAVPNAALANSSLTIAGHNVALGGTQTLSASDLTNGVTGTGAVVLATGVTPTTLTGFVAGAGTVSATDTILTAFNKIVGNINALVSGVSSVFGRTGVVTAQSGDYTVSQVTGAAPLASPTFTGTVNGAAAIWSGVDTALNFAATGTGADTLPVGTTGQEPSGVEGMIRDNTTLHMFEGYLNGAWKQVVTATNGLVNLASQVTGTLPVANGGTAGNGTTNAETGTSYTTVLGDAGNFITMSNASASTLTIPPNSNVAYPVGSVLCAQQIGAGVVTLTQGSGVTFTDTCTAPTAPVFSAQYATICATQTATNTWAVVGKCQ